MRIDLHIHTQNCKKGDGESRIISPYEFTKKMAEYDVKICSITNHNKFDLVEYNTVVQLAPELVIFPGIELDVIKDDTHCHIIVICDPAVKIKFHDIFDNDNGRVTNTYSLLYSDFLVKVKEFNVNEIIIIPHFADKDRAIGKNLNDSPKNELKGYVVILETAKLHTMGIINSNGHLSLIGSDVKDWKKYPYMQLPEIKFRINTFKKFYELTNNSDTFIKNYLQSSPKNIVSMRSSSSLTIYDDINVIIGEKGSGKTILLKSYLKPYFESQGKKTFLHEGKEYQSLYSSMIQKLQFNIEVDEDLKQMIIDDFDHIISYQEKAPSNFVRLYIDYRKSAKKSNNRRLLKKADASFSNTATNDFKKLLDQCKSDVKSVDKVIDINNKLNRELAKKVELDSELTDLRNDLLYELERNYKEIFTLNSMEHFYRTLKLSAKKNSGSESKPSTLGFAALVANRLKRMKCNVNIIENLKIIQKSETQKLGYLPGKGEAFFNTKVLILSRKIMYEKDSVFEKGRIKLNRNLMIKIEDFSTDCFKVINDYFDSAEKGIDGLLFSKDVIKKESLIRTPDNNNYEPSEGEKAILSISGILENFNYDCYLFDEVERGLGHKYVTEYVIPQLIKLRDSGKTIVISTHNANLAINTLPSQCIYCDYKNEQEEVYYSGNMYSDILKGIETGNILSWEKFALLHLEGSEEMFNRRKNIYGL